MSGRAELASSLANGVHTAAFCDELDGDTLAVIGLQVSPVRFPFEEYAAVAARLVAAFEHICCPIKGLIAP